MCNLTTRYSAIFLGLKERHLIQLCRLYDVNMNIFDLVYNRDRGGVNDLTNTELCETQFSIASERDDIIDLELTHC